VYGVIYADPPWKFKTYSDKGLGRSAEAHYDCMSLDEIKALPIPDFCLPDCVLLLWVTDPFLFKSQEIISAWKFTYKTVGFYWIKGMSSDSEESEDIHTFFMGNGYWTRANPEQCLLATRGHPRRINADVRKLIVAPRREHSRKPDEVYPRIERLCSGPYLELFARQRREGWDTIYSSEIDSGPNLERRWSSSSGPISRPDLSELDDL
jgi:N6-adenosine-specific RNA methylase IME4